MCPLLVTLIAIIWPCISSSMGWSDARSFSFTATSPSAVASSTLDCELPFGPLSLTPSFDTRVRSGLVCLVAAKMEGEEMGQYVMALYRQSNLHLGRPSHCGTVSVTVFMASCRAARCCRVPCSQPRRSTRGGGAQAQPRDVHPTTTEHCNHHVIGPPTQHADLLRYA
jgi:hypothetical protein